MLLFDYLALDRCPHCSVAKPNLWHQMPLQSVDKDRKKRFWGIYVCGTCGGVVSAWSDTEKGEVTGWFPTSPNGVSDDVPAKPRELLQQALASGDAPAGAVLLAASAVDAMLKAKGLTKGSLNDRIDQAAKQHVITDEMAKWAHQVRLDANDQRHADEVATLPTSADAERSVEFARALAEILFVLPARVTRGLKGP